MKHIMGIDGGGSTLRVVIVSPDLEVLGESHGSMANPSVIGREAAAEQLEQQIQAALDVAGLNPYQIDMAGVGIAGAAAAHSADWLHSVLSQMLPAARLALSSDMEIALVGAHGKPE